MNRQLILCLICVLPMLANAHEHTFDVPVTFYKNPFVIPAAYLESYDEGVKELGCGAFLELKNLFLASAYYSKVNYGQDYSISTSAEIYLLLKTNLPDNINLEERENNSRVMLGEIAGVLLSKSRAINSAVKCKKGK